MRRLLVWAVVAAVLMIGAQAAVGDTLELRDGRIISNCFLRDEASQVVVWQKLSDVGTTKWEVFPRPSVKTYKIERDDPWDVHPALPDLSVSYIEMTPKLAGLHGHVDYDNLGRPVIKGPGIPDLGERAAMEPEEAVKGLKLKYKPGEEITLTAHVRNNGFKSAKPFSYVWLIDDKEVSKGQCAKSLKELEEISFPIKWNWQEGFHNVTFKVITDQPEIAVINNQVTDPLWGWGLVYVVSPARVKTWHNVRTAYGTFSFEDYYRWHIDIMNKLFAVSVYPASPEGIKARVRLDRIVYAQDPLAGAKTLTEPDGLSYLQGAWTWTDSEEELKTGKIVPPSKEGYTSTEWSLPHELGHQLGLVDYYFLDDGGTDDHLWPDNGERICHFMNHPNTMMHSHGPVPYSEMDAGYFNQSYDKPRGHFGDYYFAIPTQNYLNVIDVNGRPVQDADIEIFQRGAVVDTKGQPGEDQGVKYFPVVEDGDFDHPMSKDPVIVGKTNEDGIIRLPNRPVVEVRTLNGFHRVANPFGNLNVLGNRGYLLVKVTKGGRATYFSLEITDYVSAWFRGQKDKFTYTLRTPYGSVGSPPSPSGVIATPFMNAESGDPHTPADVLYTTPGDQYGRWRYKVTWNAPWTGREPYLDRVTGYRVYRRIGPMCLNDRPWFPVATLPPDSRQFVVDLNNKALDAEWFNVNNRFAVTSIGELGVESELVEAPIPAVKK